METFAIASLFLLSLIFFVSFYFLRKASNKPKGVEKTQERVRNVGEPARVGGVRVKRAVARGGNRRVVEAGDVDEDDENSDTDEAGNNYDGEDGESLLGDKGKVGAKKAKKMEMKAEKKALREAMEVEREELKQRQEEREKERKKREMRREMEEKEAAEREEQLRREKKQKEEEEYQKLKGMFTVEEEGTDKLDEEESANLLQEFIQFIKDEKVVVLEDLAARFKLKTQDTIDRIRSLCDEGQLTGVVDDRGKFIYVTNQEYQDVARFIKQRGRVSIVELSENMNTIIQLQGASQSAPPVQASA